MSGGLLIHEESPDQPEVCRLLEARDAFSAVLYPAESNHGLDIMALLKSEVTFLVVRCGGAAPGCAALVRGDGSDGEIKSMFVRAAGGLAAVKVRARSQGLAVLLPETGIHQHAALKLHRTAGYREIERFGSCQPDSRPIFKTKS